MLVKLSEEYILSDGNTEDPGFLAGIADIAIDFHLTFRQVF